MFRKSKFQRRLGRAAVVPLGLAPRPGVLWQHRRRRRKPRQRTADMPEVHVFMAEGRTDEQKKNMMLDITQALVDNLGVSADVVTVQVIEAKLTEKMKGGKTFAER
jgi:4-oxalocrotonate tautomerase